MKAALATAALVTTGMLLAGCAGAGSVTTATATSTVSAAVGSATPGGIFDRALNDPAVTVTGGRLYVLWQLNPDSAAPLRIAIALVDQATGAVQATHRFPPGYVGAPLAAGGWLWVPTSTAAGESLLRMTPAGLAVTEDLRTGRGSYLGGTVSADYLAVAGGFLWVAAADRLLRVSLPDGRVTAVITLPDAVTSAVAASADGSVLVVSEATGTGVLSVQRRDPVTGALLASHPTLGDDTAPGIGGVIGSGAWIAEATGMGGYVERIGTATMAPDRATAVVGTNGIGVRIADGVVWVTDYVGGARRNYCANPVTGRRLATIPLPDLDQDILLAISGRVLYYAAPASNGLYLRITPVPAACLG